MSASSLIARQLVATPPTLPSNGLYAWWTLDLARMEDVLRSDLVLYVDDLSHLGDDAVKLDSEGEELDSFHYF